MKYILSVFKIIGFLLIFTFGFIGFIYFANKNSWWALPILLGWLGLSLSWLSFTEVKKCLYCKNKCRTTGVSGSFYKQWYCNVCGKKFWTTLFLQDYE